jgi:hypothetical protein
LVSAIALAGNRHYYQSNAITGWCTCRARSQDPIEFPCPTVEVIITDAQGKELSRAQTSSEFAFRVQKDRPYRLQVRSDKFRVESPLAKDVFLGDDVLVRMIRK